MKLSLALLSLATADILPSFGSSGLEPSAAAGNCPKITCVMFCKNGMQKNARGCDICSCAGAAGKGVATTSGSCTRDEYGCCSELGVAWCPDQNSCVSTRNAVIPCKSWGSNPPVTAARATVLSAGSATQSAPVQTFAPAQSTSAQIPLTINGANFALPPATASINSANFASLPASTSANSANFALPASTSVNSANFALPASTNVNSANFAPLPASTTSFSTGNTLNIASGATLNTRLGNSVPAPLSSATSFNTIPLNSANANAGLGISSSVGLPDSTSACSPVMCAMFCPSGMLKDARGCDMCACAGATPNACPSTADCSSRACPGGYSKDNRGCPTCICLGGSAPVVTPTTPSTTNAPVVAEPRATSTFGTSLKADALVAVDRPSISLNPCLPAPGPCKKNQKCVPSPKQCFTTPCPQYTCVPRAKAKGGN